MHWNFKSVGTYRPNASPGYWLCCLLPIAFLASNYRQPKCSLNFEYKVLTISSFGMCMQSLNFFIYLSANTGRLMKIIFAFSPGIVVSLLFDSLLQQKPSVCIFWGFTITFAYQYAYIRIIRDLPNCFTYGEACILVQGLILFLLNCMLQLPLFIWTPPTSEFGQINAIMMGALFCLVVVCWLLATVKLLRSVFLFYPLLLGLLIAVCTIPMTKKLPIITIIYFIYTDLRKIYIIVFYIGLVGVTVCTVWWQLRSSEKASTRVRKIFHALIVFVFVPGLIFQCTLLYIASGVALAFFTVLELFRIIGIPPLGTVLKDAFSSFCDEKDAGAIALTPFCLLIGCSLPIWINPCPCDMLDTASGANLLALLAGILSIGIGDAAASVFGSKFGKHKWRNSSRSIEGTLAFIVSQSAAIYGLHYCNFIHLTKYKIISTAAAILTTSIVEALTDQIDNLVLPLIFYIIVNLA